MYKHVISLGEACDVAHNIRRVFGIEAAQFFDWHVTSFEALVAAIDADLEGVGDKVLLRKNRNTAIDQAYGIQLQHAFTRGADGLVSPETVDREHPEAREKLRFLRKRWLRTLREPGPFLFVAHHDVEQARLEALHALLDAKTAGPCDLLCLHHPEDIARYVARPGVNHAMIRRSGRWQGDPGSWDAALSDIVFVGSPTDITAEQQDEYAS